MHFRQISPEFARAAFVACSALFAGVIAAMRVMLGRFATWRVAPRVAVAVLAGGGALVWWLINGQVEGAVLFEFSARHGVTEADLLVIPHLAAALYVAVARP